MNVGPCISAPPSEAASATSVVHSVAASVR